MELQDKAKAIGKGEGVLMMDIGDLIRTGKLIEVEQLGRKVRESASESGIEAEQADVPALTKKLRGTRAE